MLRERPEFTSWGDTGDRHQKAPKNLMPPTAYLKKTAII